MQESSSEAWENQVEPLKIKSALSRRGSKSKLRGPREFSPVIGSTRPKKAVTFDRTDEVITYEQLTPEVHGDWRFNEPSFETHETYEQNPLHTLPSIPEQKGIEKSISEPSLHTTLNENRLSRVERLDAVLDSSSSPSFRPGHKHKDSWRGSWGTISDSLGQQQDQHNSMGYSPHIEENYLFEELPGVARKESLQDEQRRPKTISMHAGTAPSNTLERTHSQRKKAIRSILESESSKSPIHTIAEEEDYEHQDDSAVPPEIPPHSPTPEIALHPKVAGLLKSQAIPISPSLESVATFEANFGSVERAESSTPVLTSFNNNSPRNEVGEFDFGKTRTSTPSTHIVNRVPSSITEVTETSSIHHDDSIKPSEEMDITDASLSSPKILAPLAPLTPEPQHEMPEFAEEVHHVEIQNYRDEAKSNYSDEDIEPANVDRSLPESNTLKASTDEVSAPSHTAIDLPEIPDMPVTNNSGDHFNLPELSMSPYGLDAHMFDSSGNNSSLHVAQQSLIIEDENRTETSEKILDSIDNHTNNDSMAISITQPAETQVPISQSQISIAGNATFDANSSIIAVHDKHYTTSTSPNIVEEELEPVDEVSAAPVIDTLQAPSIRGAAPAFTRDISAGQLSQTHQMGTDELDHILDDSVTQETINISALDEDDFRPHPEFSFVENRNITPLAVSSLVTASGIPEPETANTPFTEGDLPVRSGFDIEREINMNEGDLELAETTPFAPEDNYANVSHEVPFQHTPSEIHNSTSIEPLVIRPMDASNHELPDETPDASVAISRDPSTNMISPPTSSQAYSNPSSRVISGASTANNTVLHTPFPDDSLLTYPPRPSAPLGFSDDIYPEDIQEKHYSPVLNQDDLILDSDLSDDDDVKRDENEWVTETESEFGSNRRIDFGASIFGDYASKIPSRIPTFQVNSSRPVSASDIGGFTSTEPSSQAFGYPSSVGTSTVPESTNSRWSIDSLREDSMMSMQMGQSLDDFSMDLNRVASTATTDGVDKDSGYVLRESDSVIMANADRIFKSTRRRVTTRRKPVPVTESLETHKEEPSEDINEAEEQKSLSVRKRNEQNSFTTRQPSHIAVSRNATPQKVGRDVSSRHHLAQPQDGSFLNTSGVVAGRVSSSNYGSREPSLAAKSTRKASAVGLELPDRSMADVEPVAKITEASPVKDASVHIDVRQPPPVMGRMANIEELRETPKTEAGENFKHVLASEPIMQEHKPRPASSYTRPLESTMGANTSANMSANISGVSTETYRNRHKSCPVLPQEKGHLFISIDSVSGYELPGGTMVLNLDNGEQQITTNHHKIGKVTEFNQEYDILVHDGLTCEVSIRAFNTEIKEKRSGIAKLFKRKKENHKRRTPVSSDGTMGHCKIKFSDVKQYAFGKPYSAVLPCYDRLNMNQTCQVNVRMMYVPIMSRDDKFPATMKEALEEIALAKRSKVTAMTGYMTQHGGDCRKPKRRYFILDDDMLIAHSDQSFKARATINLRKAVYLAPDENDSNKFRVNFRNGAFINFTVESERQKWMEAFDTTIHNKRNRSSWISLVLYATEDPINPTNTFTKPQAVI